jgi:putative endonuclease
MTQTSRHRGIHGEQIAQHHLQSRGFQLEALNWRFGRQGEIDIVAYHSGERLLAFVEVKTRKGADFGSSLEAVNAAKQAQLRTLAEIYLAQRQEADGTETRRAVYGVRFDVLGIYFPGGGRPAEIQHIENAF